MFLMDHLVTKWLESKRLKVQPQRCIRTRNRFSSCHNCANLCPVSAISLENGLTIQEDVCTECMRCTVDCPTEAFYDEKYIEFFKEMSNREVISFSCENDNREEPHIKLGCLFQLDKALLLHASLNSNKVTIQYSIDKCMKCNKYDESLESTIRQTIAQLNSMLKKPIDIYYNEKASSKMERNYTRRELITFFSKKMTRNVVSPLISEEEERNLREFLKSGAMRDAYQYLLIKHQGLFIQRQQMKNLNTLQLVLDNKCDGCRVCERVCPTGALKFSEEDPNIIGMFSTQLCNGCKSCIDICRKNALEMDNTSYIDLHVFLNEKEKVVFTKELKQLGEPY